MFGIDYENSFETAFCLWKFRKNLYEKDVSALNEIISALQKEFNMKLGSADTFVGIHIIRDIINKTILLHQESYKSF